MDTVTDAASGVTGYGYDAAGNRTSVQDARGKTTSCVFDDDGRPLTVTDPLGRVLLTFSYDSVGREATRRDNRGITTTDAYSLRNELLSASCSNGQAAIYYAYDADGNRLTLSDVTGVTGYQYDALNRLSLVGYPNGNQVLYPTAGQTATYAYDQANRMLSVARRTATPPATRTTLPTGRR